MRVCVRVRVRGSVLRASPLCDTLAWLNLKKVDLVARRPTATGPAGSRLSGPAPSQPRGGRVSPGAAG